MSTLIPLLDRIYVVFLVEPSFLIFFYPIMSRSVFPAFDFNSYTRYVFFLYSTLAYMFDVRYSRFN